MCFFKKDNIIFPHPPIIGLRGEWKIMEDVVPTFSCNFDFISVLGSDEWVTSFSKIRKRVNSSKNQANLGIYDAEHLLLEHQEEIPASLHNKYIIFPGTLVYMDGFLPRIPCLKWKNNKWELSMAESGFPWFKDTYLAFCK